MKENLSQKVYKTMLDIKNIATSVKNTVVAGEEEWWILFFSILIIAECTTEKWVHAYCVTAAYKLHLKLVGVFKIFKVTTVLDQITGLLSSFPIFSFMAEHNKHDDFVPVKKREKKMKEGEEWEKWRVPWIATNLP